MKKILNSPLASFVVLVVIIFVIVRISLMSNTVTDLLQLNNEELGTGYISYSDTLHVVAFAGYFPEAIVREFESEYDVKINVELFESSLELRHRLDAGATYDLIVVNDYLVEPFAEAGYLIPISHNQIPNYSYIDDRFRSIDFDYGNQYSIPFLWGTVGVSYNTNYVVGLPLSWEQLFEPERIEYLRGNISILDDYRVTIGIMLQYLGYDPNTTNENEIAQATNQLLQLVPYIAFDHLEVIEQDILSEDLYMSMMWSGDAAMISSKNRNVRYTLPSEGTIFWVDNLAITRTSENQSLAYRFIDFLLNPRVIADISNLNYHANPVTDSRRYIDRHILNGPAYTNPYVSGNVTLITDIGEYDSLYQRYWDTFTDSLQSHMESVTDTLRLSPSTP
ncbi:MAG: spermidine/putrescine ABC transporter substrate-binding protein [Balneolaceae bacterium]